MNKKIAITFSAVVFLAACQVHKVDLAPVPLVEPPKAYAFLQGTQSRELKVWYDDFSDPALNGLITSALQDNFSLRASLARLDQARALADSAGADGKPVLESSGSINRSRSDGDTARTGQFGLVAAWQIDAFQRLKSTADAREFEAQAAANDVTAVKLALGISVADAYFSARTEREVLRLLQDQLRLDTQSLNLVSKKMKEGIGSNLDVLRQKAQVAETESLIPNSEAALRQFENRLDVLLGQPADPFDRTVSTDKKSARPKDLPKIGVPSDLVVARPDLRAEQGRLIAADAQIAAAIADRLPKITLDGSYLYSKTALTSGPVAAVAASFAQTLLDWGKKQSEVTLNKALYQERLATFTQNYLQAVADVENALYAENRQREFIDRLVKRRKVLQETLRTTQLLYDQGLGDYLSVIDVLRQLRQIERDVVRQRLELVRNRLSLFQALGGPV